MAGDWADFVAAASASAQALGAGDREEVQALVEKLHGYPEAIVEKAVQMTKIEE